ncbi:unnamed protein product [Gongylonema pulchrum]|uniref:Dolichyl-diphosphooligosaccharide--protein glycosyltransferase subunit 2 n=1 Tax=Gongylonema pulchrum TaxID=637853 RepID=A0A183E4I6_9BILA|nr:unnamed protein product [Gongylonema pulchrum]
MCTVMFFSFDFQVNELYLQLEGGLSITAFGVYGIYTLADKLNKSPNVKSDEAVKLANYLLSRRNVQLDRGAYLLMVTLKKLANNNFQIPVVFSLASSMSISDVEKPLRIRVSNVLGESVGPLSVTLDAATHSASREVVVVRESLKRVDSDSTNTLYEVSIAKAKQRGFYNLAFTAGSQADIHSKMEIKFKIKEARTGDSILVHQAFVAFVHKTTRQEIIFVATPDRDNNYVFDADFEKVAKDFEGLSGKYEVRLIIGDAAVSHPFDWNLVDVSVTLPAVPAQKIKKSERIIYDKLPEIKHMFREPEKRPPQIVSTTFVVLCAIPLLILLILVRIFGLYFVFWLRLNMFETLKYLSMIGAVTFISGNRLLRTIAARRK